MSHKQLSLNLKTMAESMDTGTVNLVTFKFKLIINYQKFNIIFLKHNLNTKWDVQMPIFKDEYRPLKNQYQGMLKDQIGEGSYGKVFRVTLNDEKYALKVIKVPKDISDDDYDKFKREIYIQTKLSESSDYIVKLHEFWGENTIKGSLKASRIILKMEFCRKSLRQWLRDTNARPFPNCISYYLNIAQGLCYIHQQDVPIIHRDLKPENILITDDGHCKIADFGFAVLHATNKEDSDTGEDHTLNVGTKLYAAPEQISKDANDIGVYGRHADLFPMGIILMELFTVFNDKSDLENGIVNLRDNQQLPAKIFWYTALYKPLYPTIKSLIRKLISFEPKARGTSNDLVESVEKLYSHFNALSFGYRITVN
jgi:serine/threonine protein kinase